ncbi:MAG: VCBS repeat-containing protein [Planctomycetes bacterium]|nr:VCBS repeat-containing protein [Planctomycetota bacterium]
MRKLVDSAVFLFPAFLSAGAFAQTYTSPEVYNTGPNNSAADAATGDFNNDGIADLLTAHDGPAARLELRLGKGTGLFLPPTFAVPGVAMAPAFITVGDFDNDGKLDAVATGGTALCLFRGNGAGSLLNTFSVNHPAGASGGVAAADFDHNGNLDCAEVLLGPGTAIWIGTGAGTFAGGPVFASAVAVERLRVDDMDLDGEADLISSAAFAVAVRKGGPVFTFSPEQIFALPNASVDHFVADTTGDGAPEVLVCYGTAFNQFSIITNDGFGNMIALANTPTHDEATRISAADADGDGLRDVFVTCRHQSAMVPDATLDIYQNDGAGGFALNTILMGNERPRALVLADWNGDRRIDAAVGGETPAMAGVLSILFGQGLDKVDIITFASGGAIPWAVATADLNEDGHPDLVVANDFSNNVSIIFGDGAGGFGAPLFIATGAEPMALEIADLNGDRNLDIITADWTGMTLTRIDATGPGTFGAPVAISLPHKPISIAVADVDMDGDPDLIIGYRDATFLAAPAGTGYGVMINSGGGVFLAPTYVPYANEIYAIAVQDFNGDGLPDLAVANISFALLNGYMDILINIGGGTFAIASSTVSTGLVPVAIATGDANRDGVMDVVMSNFDVNNLALFMGAGGGAFGAATSYATGTNPWGVILTDINSDGVGELINTNFGDSTLTRRHFGAAVAVTTATGTTPVGLACADFKSRGKVDFVTANATDFNCTVLLDAGSQPFGVNHYGTGTGGAAGRLAMGSPRSPRINDLDYNLTCTGAPASSLGLGYGGDAIDFAGSDAFGVGALIHVDLASSTTFVLFDIYSDAQGNAYAATPIPNDPGLVGMTFYIQSLWVERAADGRATTNAAYDIVTSRGLKVDITN